MPRRIALTVEDCRRLKSIVDSLDTQSGIATSAGVGQPWLSYVLRGHRTTNVDSARLELLATELAGRVRKEHASRELSDEQASATLHFLGRFTNTPEGAQSELHSPGGPVPPDAIPYVKRYDGKLNDPFKMRAFDLLVWGPQQSGKSTAIARLERRAQQLGYETAWFDPQTALNTAPRDGLDREIDAGLASAIFEFLQVKWGLRIPDFEMADPIAKVSNWLLNELAPTAAKPRLLILDDLSHVGHATAGRWIGRFVRNIGNFRRMRRIRLSLAVGLTYQFGANFSAQLLSNSSLHWTERVDVDWFLPGEVDSLVTTLREGDARIGGELPSSAELYEMFRGQPYLTHAAAEYDAFFAAVQAWMNKPDDENAATLLRDQPWYRRHLAAARFALFGPTYKPEGDAAHNLLVTFLNACSRTETDPKPDINHDQEDFFLRSRLLNKAGLPALNMYRLFAEDLKGMAG